MQRSSRFDYLSGLSGIVAGLLALVGAGVVYWYLARHNLSYGDVYQGRPTPEAGLFLVLVALVILLLALGSVLTLTALKAQKANESIWHLQGQRMFSNLGIPLLAGGVFCLLLVYHQLLYLIAPSMLIFYGLALINSSKYTFPELRYLGLGQIVLGLIAGFGIEYGLLAWAAGFGGLNMLYGALLYHRYEKR